MHNMIDNRYSSTYYHQIILRKKYRLKMAGKVKLYLSNRISFKKASIILHKAENMENHIILHTQVRVSIDPSFYIYIFHIFKASCLSQFLWASLIYYKGE